MNRHFPFTPAIPNTLKPIWNNTDRLYDYIWIIKELLKIINRDSDWLENLKILLLAKGNIDKTKMGFHDEWETDVIWNDLKH